ncbi:MAG: chemotaxis protein CheC [Limnochordaceae bacterium]|uniref:Chemotaxis protein CheC n=1 Tax=Carboxydichorda subterranea TaxID=3109565 RepID=A0ABZ1BYL5_9FIRM|nr:chemotaxis protein CheC [Limnochorda sp. L945t]MBE3598851.1 chemotaxis protein CheC [Limnochordaceae bacterium]WRP17891.1 chemotaxis protein CheC [Limnochorda sp. L945t]
MSQRSSGGGLSDLEKDALAELGTIGAGGATTALSQMLGDRLVRMSSPRVEVVPLAHLPERVGPADELAAAVYVRLDGDLKGSMALVIPEAAARSLLLAILPEDLPGASATIREDVPMGERTPGDMAASALMEVGNIVVSAYLNAMSEITGLKLVPSVPSVATDMVYALIASILAESPPTDDQVLTIDTHFETEGASVGGEMIFLPAEGHLTRLLDALGVTGEESS